MRCERCREPGATGLLARSPQADEGAEGGAGRGAAVRWQEIGLLGADAQDMDIGYAGLFELDPVRRGKVEEKSIAGGCYEFRVELRGDLSAHLVAAAADSGPDACQDVLSGRARRVIDRPP